MTYSFTKENVRYLYFLFGILSYWLLGAIWGQCFYFIYDLYSVLDPVMVVAGSALLELAVIFFLISQTLLFEYQVVPCGGGACACVPAEFFSNVCSNKSYGLLPFVRQSV